jgi:hypothetical protein
MVGYCDYGRDEADLVLVMFGYGRLMVIPLVGERLDTDRIDKASDATRTAAAGGLRYLSDKPLVDFSVTLGNLLEMLFLRLIREAISRNNPKLSFAQEKVIKFIRCPGFLDKIPCRFGINVVGR